jgi:hypothetical protein
MVLGFMVLVGLGFMVLVVLGDMVLVGLGYMVGTRINQSNAQRCLHHQKHKLLGLLVVKQPLTSSGEERRVRGAARRGGAALQVEPVEQKFKQIAACGRGA